MRTLTSPFMATSGTLAEWGSTFISLCGESAQGEHSQCHLKE